MEKGMDWEQRNLFNEITRGRDLAKQLQNHLRPSSSAEMRLLLVEKILCSNKKALSMLMNSSAFSGTNLSSIGMPESPPSAANSTEAASSKKDISKRRGYYRCTHRYSQGCLATKQIQRSDDDPTIFEVRYVGTHTCKQSSHLVTAAAPVEAASNRLLNMRQFPGRLWRPIHLLKTWISQSNLTQISFYTSFLNNKK